MTYTTETGIMVTDAEVREASMVSTRFPRERADEMVMDTRAIGAAVFDKKYGSRGTPLLHADHFQSYEGLGLYWPRLQEMGEGDVHGLISVIEGNPKAYVSRRAMDAAHKTDERSVLSTYILLNAPRPFRYSTLQKKMDLGHEGQAINRHLIEVGAAVGYALQLTEIDVGVLDFSRTLEQTTMMVQEAVERAAVDLRWGKGAWEEERRRK